MKSQNAHNVLSVRSEEIYNKQFAESDNDINFRKTYRKYRNYIPWPTPCEVSVEISRMANCEHLAAESLGQSKFEWAERTLKQQRGIPEEARADRWVWRQWAVEKTKL